MRKIRFILTALVMVLCCEVLFAQNIKVKGTVTESGTGEPVPFASIQVKGTMTGAATDIDGRYTMDVPKNATLVFSSIGYITQEILVDGRGVIDVVLAEDTERLDDVVVVAYGTAKKESVTGAISTVKSDFIEKRPISSVSAALEGAAAGVMVNNTYGEPGTDATIRIRGFGSVNGSNSPLYVIDGVPFGGNISDLNPNDIESLTVLKDATSAALYGNRASNGVIIITTKRGKTDKVQLSASVNQGFFTRGIPEYDRLNADQYMEAMFQGYSNSLMSSNPAKYPTKQAANAEAQQTLVSDYLGYNLYGKPDNQLFDADGRLTATMLSGFDDLNWYDSLERWGHRQDYTVTGQGATDKSNYYFSVGYLNEKGYIHHSDFSRWTARANASISPKTWIKAGVNVAASMQDSKNTSDGTAAYANPFMYARNISPIYPVFAHDLKTGAYILDEAGNKIYDGGDGTVTGVIRPQYTGRHIVWERELNMDNSKRYTTSAQTYADIKFLKDFTFTIKGDISLRQSANRTYDNSQIGDGSGIGRSKRTYYDYNSWTFQQLLNYNHEFGKHGVEAMIGHENYSYNYVYNYQFKQGETFANQHELINFAEINSLTGYQSGYKLESYFARAKYDYLSKYFVEASFRRDGSSRFYKENRWGNFWSIGGTWVISKEAFAQSLKWLDNAKLRVSYGEVGNDASVGYYSYMALYALTTNGNAGAAYKSQNAANDLRWESANTFSAALEGRLFDRWNVNIEYFNKVTKDLLFDVNLPISAGSTGGASSTAATKTQNIGSVSNRGWEITTDVDIVRTRNFRWNVGANATFLKNEILVLPEENREEGIINGTKKYMEGHGIYDFWMYQYAGVDQMSGNCLYLVDDEKYYILDQNKSGINKDGEPFDKTIVPAEYQMVIDGKEYTTYTTYAKRDWSGSSLPKVYGSFNTAVSWGNFSLSALFTYALGGKCIDYSYQSLMTMAGSPSALHADLLNAWTSVPAGMTETSPNRIDPNQVPAINFTRSTYNNATSTRFLTSGNYFVVKNIALSYKLSRKASETIGLSGLTVSASVDNLATFTALKGMNPQQSFAGTIDNYFNTARVFSLGLNITL